MSNVIGMITSEGANPMMEIERTYTFFCNKCESWFEFAYELILHDPAKCKRIKEVKNMTNLSETLVEATKRVGTNTELLQQITAIVAMNVPDDTKVILLTGIGKAIVPSAPKIEGTATPTPEVKAISPAQDTNIRAYLQSETGNLVIKGAIGSGFKRSFGTLSLNLKAPTLSKFVFTSNSLPIQIDFSEGSKTAKISYTLSGLSEYEIQSIQKFLANPPIPKEKPASSKKVAKKADVPNPQQATIDQSAQVQIFSEASVLLKNGLASNMEEALAKAKQARGMV